MATALHRAALQWAINQQIGGGVAADAEAEAGAELQPQLAAGGIKGSGQLLGMDRDRQPRRQWQPQQAGGAAAQGRDQQSRRIERERAQAIGALAPQLGEPAAAAAVVAEARVAADGQAAAGLGGELQSRRRWHPAQP